MLQLDALLNLNCMTKQIQLIIHKPQANIYTLFWCFDLITRSSSEEAGTQFFRVSYQAVTSWFLTVSWFSDALSVTHIDLSHTPIQVSQQRVPHLNHGDTANTSTVFHTATYLLGYLFIWWGTCQGWVVLGWSPSHLQYAGQPAMTCRHEASPCHLLQQSS